MHLAPGPLAWVEVPWVCPPHTSLPLHGVPLPAPGVDHHLLPLLPWPDHAALPRPPPLPIQLTWQRVSVSDRGKLRSPWRCQVMTGAVTDYLCNIQLPPPSSSQGWSRWRGGERGQWTSPVAGQEAGCWPGSPAAGGADHSEGRAPRRKEESLCGTCSSHSGRKSGLDTETTTKHPVLSPLCLMSLNLSSLHSCL